MCVTKIKEVQMEGKKGRPTDSPKVVQTRIRMTKEESEKLNECSKKLNISKTEVVVKGIEMIYEKLKNN